jgi:ATP-dependent helicase HrpA
VEPGKGAPERSVSQADITALRASLGDARLADVPALTRRLDGLARAVKRGRDPAGALAALAADIDASVHQVSQARDRLPDPMPYPTDLPVSQRREEIQAAIRDHPVVVVCGETGSGKTTQLPKMCLELGLGARGLIGHTQPRRIAARSVASRIGAELGKTAAGADGSELVGWKVRFADHTRPDCRIKLMTDGILLAEIPHDRSLRQYDTLIIDEAHERSLNIDFLLGYLKQLLPRRPDLKIVITSATIDPDRFSRHFNNAPVVEVSGRTWPVDIRYRPVAEDTSEPGAVVNAVGELAGEPGTPPGDTLVFLAGEREIRETAEALRKHHPEGTEILPLYSRLSAAEQDRVFRSAGRRRIVLATNVAETSLTVPGIRHVIDPGFARISRYSFRSKIQRLQVEPVSQASANQRKGRCGREAAGICIRLYDEEAFESRPEFTEPELLRTNLASVILRMETLGLGHIEDFPFVEPPDPRFVRDGYRLLKELRAVGADGRVTALGREIGRLPVDPRLGRILVAGRDSACLAEALAIVSFLSVQDPRERPVEKRQQADEQHAEFADERSDFVAVLNLWTAYREVRRHQSVSRQRRWCRERFLSFPRMREWHDIHQQLLAQVKDAGWRLNQVAAAYPELHGALLTGFLGHIGERTEDRSYEGARGLKFHIFPGSGVAARPPRWITAASLVQTTRTYARMTASVEPGWIERAAPHLVRRSYSDPHWQEGRGFVGGYEQVSLYGRILVSKRPVDFGRVVPEKARAVFVEEGLVNGRIRTRGKFLAKNQALIAGVRSLEARLRRRDLLASPEALADFYAARVPESVCSTHAFERWRKKAEKGEPATLEMALEDVLATGEVPNSDDWPETLRVDGEDLPLSYVFDPADAADGVTVTVTRHWLAALPPEIVDWVVPGLVQEKIVEMLRRLPKTVRRRLVPLPDTARRVLADLRPGEERLAVGLSRELKRHAGVDVAPAALDMSALPPYLNLRIEVREDNGQRLGSGRDLAALRSRYGLGDRPLPAARASDGWTGSGLRDWSFGPIPGPEDGAGTTGPAVYPGIRDEGDGVALELYASEGAARAATREGVLRLFKLAVADKLKYARKELARNRSLGLAAADLSASGGLLEDIIDAACVRAFLGRQNVPRSPEAFAGALEAGRSRVVATAQEIAALVDRITGLRRDLNLRLDDGVKGPGATEASADIRGQLDGLFQPGFVGTTPTEWLEQYPRYLEAAKIRLDRLASGRSEGRERAAIGEHAARLREHQRREWPTPAARAAFEEYRWLTEEFRVSLFAQTLGTRVKVSAVRLERAWEALAAAVNAAA